RRRVRRPDRVCGDGPRRPQDGAPGSAGAARAAGELQRRPGRGAAARPALHLRRDDRRRAGRPRDGAVEEGRGAGSRAAGAREPRPRDRGVLTELAVVTTEVWDAADRWPGSERAVGSTPVVPAQVAAERAGPGRA